MHLTALKDHLISAVATAAVLGGGATIVSTRIDNAVQDQRIAQLEELNGNVEDLQKDLARTREELAKSGGRQ